LSFAPTQDSQDGRANFWLALHEIGHALGLDHDQSALQKVRTFLPTGEDNQLFTVMSYNQYYRTNKRRPITPMLYDIAQLQAQYGRNTTYNQGDTSYRFTDTSHPFTASGITARPDQVLMTLWDAGGDNDTLDASGVTTNVKLDLRQGEFSAIGTNYQPLADKAEISNPAYNVGIAFDTVLENATGSSASSTLQRAWISDDKKYLYQFAPSRGNPTGTALDSIGTLTIHRVGDGTLREKDVIVLENWSQSKFGITLVHVCAGVRKQCCNHKHSQIRSKLVFTRVDLEAISHKNFCKTAVRGKSHLRRSQRSAGSWL
jgi:Peptidase M10 serralysin C terminal